MLPPPTMMMKMMTTTTTAGDGTKIWQNFEHTRSRRGNAMYPQIHMVGGACSLDGRAMHSLKPIWAGPAVPTDMEDRAAARIDELRGYKDLYSDCDMPLDYPTGKV